jgi:hypothetical protein
MNKAFEAWARYQEWLEYGQFEAEFEEKEEVIIPKVPRRRARIYKQTVIRLQYTQRYVQTFKGLPTTQEEAQHIQEWKAILEARQRAVRGIIAVPCRQKHWR